MTGKNESEAGKEESPWTDSIVTCSAVSAATPGLWESASVGVPRLSPVRHDGKRGSSTTPLEMGAGEPQPNRVSGPS